MHLIVLRYKKNATEFGVNFSMKLTQKILPSNYIMHQQNPITFITFFITNQKLLSVTRYRVCCIMLCVYFSCHCRILVVFFFVSVNKIVKFNNQSIRGMLWNWNWYLFSAHLFISDLWIFSAIFHFSLYFHDEYYLHKWYKYARYVILSLSPLSHKMIHTHSRFDWHGKKPPTANIIWFLNCVKLPQCNRIFFLKKWNCGEKKMQQLNFIWYVAIIWEFLPQLIFYDMRPQQFRFTF